MSKRSLGRRLLQSKPLKGKTVEDIHPLTKKTLETGLKKLSRQVKSSEPNNKKERDIGIV